jgi:hypothetical protein
MDLLTVFREIVDSMTEAESKEQVAGTERAQVTASIM